MVDVFIFMRYLFESDEVKELNKKIFEIIYYGVLIVSYVCIKFCWFYEYLGYLFFNCLCVRVAREKD